nr:MAG TPA: hypothetical protein [Caudoviricetes sp.]
MEPLSIFKLHRCNRSKERNQTAARLLFLCPKAYRTRCSMINYAETPEYTTE